MRFSRIVAILCFMMVAAAGTAFAADVAVLINTAYVGYNPGDYHDEASNVEATLVSQGHTVNTFTDISATGFNDAVSGQDALVIPELESGDLNAAIDAAARTALADFVSSGGIFIGFGSNEDRYISLVNAVFGFSLSSGSYGDPYSLNAIDAAGTSFEGGPASLPYNNDTTDIDDASLPPSTKIIYNSGSDVGVFMAPFGSGWVIFIGWDWFDAAPTGSLDNGWLSVLNAAVTVNAETPPTVGVPTMNEWGTIILSLLVAGSTILFLRRRKRVT
jgi:hypothetical protein